MGIRRYNGVNSVSYQWKYQYKGKPHTGTFDTDSEREAKDLFLLKQAEIRQGIAPATKPKQQVKLLSEFLEIHIPKSQRERSDLKHIYEAIADYFGDWRIEKIRPEDVATWRDHRATIKVRTQSEGAIAKNRAGTTVNKEKSVLSAIFRVAIEKGYVIVNPCHGVSGYKRTRKRPQVWTKEDAKAALDQMVGERGHLRPLVLTALMTGLSRKDLFQLRVREVVIGKSKGAIHKNRAKTDQPINVPLNKAALEVLLPLVSNKRANDFVFVNPYTGKPYTNIVKSLNQVCRLAGIPRLTWHGFRHTMATWLAEEGEGVEVIARFLGHSGYAMASWYVHMATDKLSEPAERLGAWVYEETAPPENRSVKKTSKVIFGRFQKVG